ncbi:MAG: PPK2 family polyphosphate kinase [Thiotrichaceae bacterium]
MTSPYLVDQRKKFVLSSFSTVPNEENISNSFLKSELKNYSKQLGDLQHKLYAEDKRSVLIVFQAMDAAGKDSTIRAVMKGVNPAGTEVYSFKKPTTKELDHDFLWRTTKSMPERGRIGIFNRSYYEETLVVRVHPEYLKYQRLPELPQNMDDFWEQRFEAINALEKHMALNGTVILKFWLNVSKDEQKRRFLSRLNEPHKHWKFSSGDIKERGHWDEYMHAYEQAICATSTSYAPWYAIPADNKKYMRMIVAKTIVETLQSLDPQYPEVHEKERSQFDEMRRQLESE